MQEFVRRFLAAGVWVSAFFSFSLSLADSPVQWKVRTPENAAALTAKGAQVIAQYEGFTVLEADATLAAGIPADAELLPPAQLIHLHAGVIDTSQEATQARRQAVESFAGKRLHLVQWAGPVKPEWIKDLQKSGLQIVDYIPENAYLVYGDASALQSAQQKFAGASHLRWEGAYRGIDKIHPSARRTKAAAASVDGALYAIQLVHDAVGNAATRSLIDSLKLAPLYRDRQNDKYVNIVARLSENMIDIIAEQPDVISIWPFAIPTKFDERQGMIISGNLSGNTPTGPGYLAWLAGKGFSQAQFDASGLVVDVTDSGLDNGTTNVNHFALYRGGTTSDIPRVRYTRLEGTANSGSTIQGCDGHGNLNAHIIAGYISQTNSPHVDSSGYRYGLGIAPFVKVGSSVIFDPGNFTNPDYDDLASRAYRDGARISGNSWGADTAGGYDADAQNYDRLVRDAQPTGSAVASNGNQQLCFVFAAGNAGSGAQTVGSPGTAKNVITVGAAENVHSHSTANGGNDASGNDGCTTPDSEANSANDVATFSSRGPCSDSRKKPDIMAPGTHVTGGVGQSVRSMSGTGNDLTCFDGTGVCALPGGGTAGSANNFFPLGQQWYSTSSGTSHSTPAVAGGAALVYQWFLNTGLNAPSPAMIKSFLMNSARYMNGTGANDALYSNNQGMGMMNLGTAFDGTQRLFRDQLTNDLFTASGQSRVFTGTIASNSKPVRITVAWTDAPGATSGNSYNNNLDLVVVVNGLTYRGNVFSGANSTTGGSADPRNNVESVFLPAGTTGTVAITVSAANITSDGVPNVGGSLDQDFALVAYNFTETQSPVIAAAGSTLISEGCGSGNGSPDPGELVTVGFALRNVGTANPTGVVATLQTSGGVTSPSGPQNYGVLVADGPAVTNNFSFIASGVCGGTITATLALADGATSLGSATYTFTIGGVITTTGSFASATSITLNDNASATPYPSTIAVSGLTGTVRKVIATVRGFGHTYPSDAVIGLVSPDGRAVGLMAAAGSDVGVTGAYITFDDDAASQVGATITSGTYTPSGSVSGMASPAPTGTYASALSAFVGASPNGNWSLFVRDAYAEDAGSITQGWSLVIIAGDPECCVSNVPPEIVPIADQTVVVGRNLAFSVNASDPVDNDPITLTASNLPPNATFGATNGVGSFLWTNASPAGVYTTVFYAIDIDGPATESVVITCRTNEPPVLSAIGNKQVIVSNSLSFAVTATDPVGNDPITLTASNLPLNATFSSTNGNGTFAWVDAAPTGTYTVTFTASDEAGIDAETIDITVSEVPNFTTYTETFDITPNWSGGAAGSYNAKFYTNNAADPSGDGFSANGAVRETVYSVTSNSWRLGSDSTANLYLRYTITNIVSRFAVQLARWDDSPTPRFEIRYSLDGGGSYTTLFSTNGGWFAADKTFQTYDSGPISLVPAGQPVWIEVFRSTGERLLIDNVEVDYAPSGGPAPQTPPTLASIGPKSVTVGNALSFAVTATPTDGDVVSLTASNLPAGATFGATNEIGTFTWANPATAGVYNVTFNAADNDGADSETVAITVNSSGGGGGTSTTVFVETIGSTGASGDSIATHESNNRFDNDDFTMTGSGDMRNTSASSGYTGASGVNNIMLNAIGEFFQIAGINTEGYTNMSLTFGVRKSTTAESGAALIVEASTDGSSWTQVSPATGWIPSGTGTATWHFRTNAVPDALASTGMVLRFRSTNTVEWRLDDLKLTGVPAGGEEPDLTPGLVITTANQTVSFAITNLAVGGTSTNLTGDIAWVNNLGGAGTIAAVSDWLIASVALTVGTNAITVSGSNTLGVTTSAVVVITRLSNDTDGDGIPDDWEQSNFGSLTNANASSDWDLDGFIDLHEFLAGTDAANSNSYLFVSDSQTVGSGPGIVIQWPGVAGKFYALSRGTNLIEHIYNLIATNIPGIEPLNTYTDGAAPAGGSYYRIELE